MAQIDPEPNYDHRLAERVVFYLQTGDWRLFPFTQGFDDEKRRAFKHDLREALADLQDSGSARKTSAVGFIMSDLRLKETVHEWADAGGDWPEGSFPRDPVTALGSSSPIDEPPSAGGIKG
ncbi:MAG: hypothetical protein IT337_13295 [Thermomicrobiales bacterium]|nr:hypothetical protein [Thermomicrobiales bacterium]